MRQLLLPALVVTVGALILTGCAGRSTQPVLKTERSVTDRVPVNKSPRR